VLLLTSILLLCPSLNTQTRKQTHTQKVKPGSDWDFEGFEVEYQSLHPLLKVGNYYLHILIPALLEENFEYKVCLCVCVCVLFVVSVHAKSCMKCV